MICPIPFLAAVIKDIADNGVDKDIRTTVNKVKADITDIEYLKDRTISKT
jgi:hypothetical protein